MTATLPETEQSSGLGSDLRHAWCVTKYPDVNKFEFIEAMCGALILVATIPYGPRGRQEPPPNACPKCASYKFCPTCGKEC